MNSLDHYTDSEQDSQLPMSFNAKHQAEKRKPPSFHVFGVTRSVIKPRPPASQADALTTVLQGRSLWLVAWPSKIVGCRGGGGITV